MLTREQFQELSDQGPDAVFAFVSTLQEHVETLNAHVNTLNARVKELENRLGKNSKNSSNPPSSDGFRKPKSLRPKSTRKPGGQQGHQGCTLSFTEDPKHTVFHDPNVCACCGKDLSEVVGVATDQRRQVSDLPELALEVTEHRVRRKGCPDCGHLNTASFPESVPSSVQYGSRIRAFWVYLNTYQLLPYARIAQMNQDLFGASVSPGTLENAQQEASSRLEPVLDFIKEQLIKAGLIHCDESGVRIGARLHWLHTVGTLLFTLYHWHPKRGKEGMDDMDVLPKYTGRAVHDCWMSYFLYSCAHALCLAHILRELTAVRDQDAQEWAGKLICLLLEIKKAVETAASLGQSRLSPLLEARYEGRYRKLLAEGYKANPPPEVNPNKKGRPKQSAARNLLDRLQTHPCEILAFMYDFSVPFDNNLAERDIRMIKVKLKVSGGFRSGEGASAFCRIRSYLSTMRKQGRPILSALESLFQGNPVYPKAETCPNAPGV
jgi:transposase